MGLWFALVGSWNMKELPTSGWPSVSWLFFRETSAAMLFLLMTARQIKGYIPWVFINMEKNSLIRAIGRCLLLSVWKEPYRILGGPSPFKTGPKMISWPFLLPSLNNKGGPRIHSKKVMFQGDYSHLRYHGSSVFIFSANMSQNCFWTIIPM